MKLLTMTAVAAFALPLASASSYPAECPTFTKATNFLDSAPCNSCTGDNAARFSDGNPACVWCYGAEKPEDRCKTWNYKSITGALSNPCGENAKFSLGGT